MAVGVIIGGAFGKIIASLVSDVIMPPIGYLISGVNFTELKYTLPVNPMAPKETAPAVIAYGNFLQTTLDFMIVALCVFLMIKSIMHLIKVKEEKKTPLPTSSTPSKEILLLIEIRDLLKKQKQDERE